ncbi:MAG: monovalent cation/H(+) antiporter subunit G [Campylobacterota bacterium]|nr:monovalent cation/H(+) antiporter subunit G [Campylobacterota bacterium]
MNNILIYLGYLFIFIGSLFLILAALGLLRMPDTISRMHAGTKASTLGTILVILGAICIEPSLWLKLILLALFILLTNPLSSSILARSTYLKDGFFTKKDSFHIDEMKDKE